MKIIWQGTDSYLLNKFPRQMKWSKIFYVSALRLFAKISDIFAQEHYSCGQRVENNLKRFGIKKPIKQFKDIVWYPNKFKKKAHKEFNVLYYFPSNTKWNRWLYGYDFFIVVKDILAYNQNIRFIVVDGSQDMNKIYPITDFMIRPTRHDGHPRMIDECIINDIPYYYSEDGNPSVIYICRQIIDKYNERTNN